MDNDSALAQRAHDCSYVLAVPYKQAQEACHEVLGMLAEHLPSGYDSALAQQAFN